jgi:hypothetical protein
MYLNKKLNDLIGKNIYDVLDDEAQTDLDLSVDIVDIFYYVF